MTFKDLGLQQIENTTLHLDIEGHDVEVRKYLPIAEKVDFISFIVMGALDETTGRFSPIRIEAYFALALCNWYAGIKFDEDDLMNVEEVYDILETNGIIDRIAAAIGEEEYEYLIDLVNETTEDIAKYNSSAAGIIRNMNIDTDNLDAQLGDIFAKIQNREGLELLSAIKDVAGKD